MTKKALITGITGQDGSYLTELLLGIGAGSPSIAVPVAQIGMVEVREQRSAAGVGGLVGAALGLVAGGIQGRSWYDASTRLHYPRGFYLGVGAVAGAVAGLFAGRIVGSFIRTDTWLDVPDGWASGYSASTSAPVSAVAGPTACPGLASGG